MDRRLSIPSIMLLLAVLACGAEAPSGAPTTERRPTTAAAAQTMELASGGTAFGFFPSPPEPTFESVLAHFEDLGEHGDFVLIQANVPWQDFASGVDGESQSRADLRNQVTLARRNGLATVFVLDPLNGLNRREFFRLPENWEASFADPNVRKAYLNFTLWVVREFEPDYLGLASEINTYMDARPGDVEHFVSFYERAYDAVKSEAEGTRVFVTFQWDDLNNVLPDAAEGRRAYDINWEQVQIFEPRLDVWAISSYPYFVFNGGTPIPEDYYTPLVERTDKPLVIAEGGFTSRSVGPIQATPADQIGYLNALHEQLGDRLELWTYILLNDLNMEAVGEAMRAQDRGGEDLETLSLFANVGLRQADGTPKPALEVWGRYRMDR